MANNDLLRFTRLLTTTDLVPETLANQSAAPAAVAVAATRPGSAIALNDYYYAYAIGMKTYNNQNTRAGTSADNVYAGETLLSPVVGSPATGTNQTVRLTLLVGSLADSVSIYRGTGSGGSQLLLYSEFDVAHSGTGQISGGTFKGTSYAQGTLAVTNGTQVLWDDPDPSQSIGTGGTTAGTNRAENNCVILQGGFAYRPKAWSPEDVNISLASGARGKYRKGFYFSASVEGKTLSDNDEQDVLTVVGYRYLRFYPRSDTKPSKYYDCNPTVDSVSPSAQFYSAPKDVSFSLIGIDLKEAPETLF